jgi:hypothetical protein
MTPSVLDLSPHAHAAHDAARYVGRSWSEQWNCWHLVQAVQAELFGRTMPPLLIGTREDQTAAMLAVTAQWVRTEDPAADGDIVTMVNSAGLHVGVVVNGRLLHNVGGRRADGSLYGGVQVNALGELGNLGYGQLKTWRARL